MWKEGVRLLRAVAIRMDPPTFVRLISTMPKCPGWTKFEPRFAHCIGESVRGMLKRQQFTTELLLELSTQCWLGYEDWQTAIDEHGFGEQDGEDGYGFGVNLRGFVQPFETTPAVDEHAILKALVNTPELTRDALPYFLLGAFSMGCIYDKNDADSTYGGPCVIDEICARRVAKAAIALNISHHTMAKFIYGLYSQDPYKCDQYEFDISEDFGIVHATKVQCALLEEWAGRDFARVQTARRTVLPMAMAKDQVRYTAILQLEQQAATNHDDMDINGIVEELKSLAFGRGEAKGEDAEEDAEAAKMKGQAAIAADLLAKLYTKLEIIMLELMRASPTPNFEE